jgi:hypothetical protein
VSADRLALHARDVRFDWSDLPVHRIPGKGFCGTCHVPLRAGATVAGTAGPGRTALSVGRAVGEEITVDVAP